MTAHDTWKEAHQAASEMADRLGRDVGIEAVEEYGKKKYRVMMLPRPENRSGYELRVEVVSPGTPRACIRTSGGKVVCGAVVGVAPASKRKRR